MEGFMTSRVHISFPQCLEIFRICLSVYFKKQVRLRFKSSFFYHIDKMWLFWKRFKTLWFFPSKLKRWVTCQFARKESYFSELKKIFFPLALHALQAQELSLSLLKFSDDDGASGHTMKNISKTNVKNAPTFSPYWNSKTFRTYLISNFQSIALKIPFLSHPLECAQCSKSLVDSDLLNTFNFWKLLIFFQART